MTLDSNHFAGIARKLKTMIFESLPKTLALLLCIGFTCAQITPLPGWSSCGKYQYFYTSKQVFSVAYLKFYFLCTLTATGPNPATGVSIGVSNCTSSPCKFFVGQSYTFTVYATSGKLATISLNSELRLLNFSQLICRCKHQFSAFLRNSRISRVKISFLGTCMCCCVIILPFRL